MLSYRWLLIGLLTLGGIGPFWTTAASAATDPCDLLDVPEGYDFSCSVERPIDKNHWVVSVQPLDGAFAGLSELELAPLDEPVSNPEDWLQNQMKIDLSGLQSAITSVVDDQDSPFADEGWWQSLQGLKDAVHSISDLPLNACKAPLQESKNADWKIECDWGIGSLRNYMSIYLVERDGQPYTLKVQAMNERRYRHLKAIANSF